MKVKEYESVVEETERMRYLIEKAYKILVKNAEDPNVNCDFDIYEVIGYLGEALAD